MAVAPEPLSMRVPVTAVHIDTVAGPLERFPELSPGVEPCDTANDEEGGLRPAASPLGQNVIVYYTKTQPRVRVWLWLEGGSQRAYSYLGR